MALFPQERELLELRQCSSQLADTMVEMNSLRTTNDSLAQELERISLERNQDNQHKVGGPKLA